MKCTKPRGFIFRSLSRFLITFFQFLSPLGWKWTWLWTVNSCLDAPPVPAHIHQHCQSLAAQWWHELKRIRILVWPLSSGEREAWIWNKTRWCESETGPLLIRLSVKGKVESSERFHVSAPCSCATCVASKTMPPLLIFPSFPSITSIVSLSMHLLYFSSCLQSQIKIWHFSKTVTRLSLYYYSFKPWKCNAFILYKAFPECRKNYSQLWD